MSDVIQGSASDQDVEGPSILVGEEVVLPSCPFSLKDPVKSLTAKNPLCEDLSP